MKNPSDDEFVPCEDCPDSMCLTYCQIQENNKEDIAKIRNELPSDFWEDH